MLDELCNELRNWFTSDEDKHYGTFSVSGGVLSPSDFLQDGQYYRIVGSVFNDGVHQHPAYDLEDEDDFEGAVWAMAVPLSVRELSEDIDEYKRRFGDSDTPYTSESFSGYSYTKPTDENGAPMTWRTLFKDRLKKWRRLY